jgi:glutamine amidotransferase
MIVVLDYGLGNLASVVNMIARANGKATVSRNSADLVSATKIVLSGVGAFDHGMTTLRAGGWIEALDRAVLERRVPVLGICLGMQLMCKSSEEGVLPGLGWIDAEVRRFSFPEGAEQKIPHMGWNTVRVAKPNPLIAEGDDEQRFYFVHSYHAVCADPGDVLATTRHGGEVTAAFSRGNIYGAQFHPEKSHRFGMALMQRFVELPC